MLEENVFTLKSKNQFSNQAKEIVLIFAAERFENENNYSNAIRVKRLNLWI